MPGYAMEKEQVQARLARIEGQVRGIARMVEEDRYCIDVLDQVASVTKALQGVAIGLVHEHLVESNKVEVALRYGGVGRPERRYAWRGSGQG